jgi:TPR repeat protein
MPKRMICCVSLPPATISSVPIYDFAIANDKLVNLGTENYFPCCGKSICGGCVHSFEKSGNDYKCPFCNSERGNVEQVIKRAEANDPASIRMLANYYCNGEHSFPQDLTKAIELYARAAELGFSQAHCKLGNIYYDGGDMKKAKFHFEAAAMAGNDDARCNLGYMDSESGNHQRGIKHYTIAASAGCFRAMHALRTFFEHGHGVVRRESIDSALTAYNDSCAEMRSEARDTYISIMAETK